MPPGPPSHLVESLNNTLGAAFIGNIFGAMQVSLLKVHLVTDLIMTSLSSMFGITTLQTFIYFRDSSQDRLPFKLLVRKTLASHLKMLMLKICKDWLSVVRHFLMPLLFFCSETDDTNF